MTARLQDEIWNFEQSSVGKWCKFTDAVNTLYLIL